MEPYPVTPDNRYFVVRGRLWRRSNPALGETERTELVGELMQARRDVRHAKQMRNATSLRRARGRVHQVKVRLGERGPVWWQDGAPDYNRYLVVNTPYRDWYREASADRYTPSHRAGHGRPDRR
jgi:hypothetical protein